MKTTRPLLIASLIASFLCALLLWFLLFLGRNKNLSDAYLFFAVILTASPGIILFKKHCPTGYTKVYNKLSNNRKYRKMKLLVFPVVVLFLSSVGFYYINTFNDIGLHGNIWYVFLRYVFLTCLGPFLLTLVPFLCRKLKNHHSYSQKRKIVLLNLVSAVILIVLFIIITINNKSLSNSFNNSSDFFNFYDSIRISLYVLFIRCFLGLVLVPNDTINLSLNLIRFFAIVVSLVVPAVKPYLSFSSTLNAIVLSIRFRYNNKWNPQDNESSG